MDLANLYAVMAVIGPILLGLVLLWAMLRNRAQRDGIDRTEQATRENYERQSRADRERDVG